MYELSGELSQDAFITENEDIDFLNMSIISKSNYISNKKCEEILLHPPFYENSIFTYSKPIPVSIDTDEVMFLLIGFKSTLPSFLIESKPRIDNVDYIAYVFGALRIWAGFCFLQLDPTVIFFHCQDMAVSNRDTNNLPISRHRIIKFESVAKLRYRKYDNEIAESKQLNKHDHDIAVSKHDIAESKHDTAVLKKRNVKLEHQLNQIIQH